MTKNKKSKSKETENHQSYQLFPGTTTYPHIFNTAAPRHENTSYSAKNLFQKPKFKGSQFCSTRQANRKFIRV